MKSNDTQLKVPLGLPADEINAIIQYVACSGTCDINDHAELHRALLAMHDDFPTWLAARIVYLGHASDACFIKEGSAS